MYQLAKLKWQCRRGTKELDLLLKQYLEIGYLVADRKEKALFVELLKLEDNQLIGVLMGEAKAGKMQFLVKKIAKVTTQNYGFNNAK